MPVGRHAQKPLNAIRLYSTPKFSIIIVLFDLTQLAWIFHTVSADRGAQAGVDEKVRAVMATKAYLTICRGAQQKRNAERFLIARHR